MTAAADKQESSPVHLLHAAVDPPPRPVEQESQQDSDINLDDGQYDHEAGAAEPFHVRRGKV